MSYKLMFILNAIVAILFGVAFLVMPETALAQFRTETYAATVLVTRFYGAALLTIGFVLWFAKDVAGESGQKGMGIVLLASAVIGFVLTVMGTVGSRAVIRANGWIVMVIYILLALGYAYLLFMKSKMKS
jgi:hypothetical protein